MPTALMKYRQVEPQDVEHFILDDDWHMQQKLDGIRIQLRGTDVLAGNGGPSKSTTAAPVVRRIRRWAEQNPLPADLWLDGEVIGDDWWLFDAVHPTLGWRRRLAILEQIKLLAPPRWIRITPTAVTARAKHQLWDAVRDSGAEGAILKHVDGRYEDGRRVDHVLKAKITHTIDCVVLERGPGNGVNGTGNWLRLGLWRKDGTIYEVGRCSTIGKPHAEPGDVVEVKYLYAGNGGRLTQPTMLRVRDDKDGLHCDTSQLHFVSKKVVWNEGEIEAMR